MNFPTPPVRFTVDGGEPFVLQEMTNEKAVVISNIYTKLGINSRNLEIGWPLELLRVARMQRKKACLLFAICCSISDRSDEIIRIYKKFNTLMSEEDVAQLLGCILVYYTDVFKRIGKEMKNGRNKI